MIIYKEMDQDNQVQILDEVIWISLHANTLGKATNPTIPVPVVSSWCNG